MADNAGKSVVFIGERLFPLMGWTARWLLSFVWRSRWTLAMKFVITAIIGGKTVDGEQEGMAHSGFANSRRSFVIYLMSVSIMRSTRVKVISLWGERADNERQESQSTHKECCPFTEAETILCRHCFRYCHIEYLRSESLILVLFYWLEVPMKQLYITDLTSSPTVSSLPSVRLMCSFCCCNAARMTRIWHLRIRCHYKYVFLGFPEGGGMLWL